MKNSQLTFVMYKRMLKRSFLHGIYKIFSIQNSKKLYPGFQEICQYNILYEQWHHLLPCHSFCSTFKSLFRKLPTKFVAFNGSVVRWMLFHALNWYDYWNSLQFRNKLPIQILFQSFFLRLVDLNYKRPKYNFETFYK